MTLSPNAHNLIASHARSLIKRPYICTDLIDITMYECIPLLKKEFGHMRDYELDIFSSARQAVQDILSSGEVAVVELKLPVGPSECVRTRRLLMPKGWQTH